nr:GspH/FimT family pseudopilin [uncultured Halomonas sp.]
MRANKSSGFTLIELIVVVALIAILATWAVPSFSQLMARNALDRQTDRLWQAISAMRLEAAERRTTVHLCPTKDGAVCSDDWQDKLMLFVDPDGNGTFSESAGDTMIRQYPASNSAITITSNSSNHDGGFSYQPDGFTAEIGTFELCHPQLDKSDARQIVISQGRMRRDTGDEDSCQPQQS